MIRKEIDFVAIRERRKNICSSVCADSTEFRQRSGEFDGDQEIIIRNSGNF